MFLLFGMFGSVVFVCVVVDVGNCLCVVFVEMGMLLYLVCKYGDNDVVISVYVMCLLIGVWLVNVVGWVFDVLCVGYLLVELVEDVLFGVLMNVGLVIYLLLILMNVGLFEYFDVWDIYNEGM